jgi:hypothetical protein
MSLNIELCKLLISHGCNVLDLLYMSNDIFNLITEIDVCYMLQHGYNSSLNLAMIIDNKFIMIY